jgi:uncharacterized protein YlzI (FlbEa/FlbD family)
MAFVRVTIDSDKVYYINSDLIISINETRQGTKIVMVNGEQDYVNESPREIMEMAK